MGTDVHPVDRAQYVRMLTPEDHVLLADAGVTTVERVTRVTGGYVNEVHRVDGPGGPVALRKWTRKGVADVELAALVEAAADGIPVPAVLAVGEDRAVLSWVDGVRVDQVEPSRAIGRMLGELGQAVWARTHTDAGMLGWDEKWQVTPWPAAGTAMLADLVAQAADAPPGWAELALRHTLELDKPVVRVHADFNPKNVLLRPSGDGWAVAALLDWEFVFAGPGEVDLGNLLRFEPRDEPLSPFGRGVREGAEADEDAVHRGRALDLLPLAQFLTPDKPDNPVRKAVRALAAHQVSTRQI